MSQQKIICPYCGKENSANVKFCIHCGLPMNNVEQNDHLSYDTSGDRYCDNCGYKLSDGDVFCNNCGCQLGAEDYDPQKNSIPTVDKNNKKHRPLLVLLLVLSLMVICGFVFIPDALDDFDMDFSSWLNTKKTASTSRTETMSATQSTTTSTTQTQKQTYYVGQVVTMGEFEQDDDIGNGKEPIKWDVIDVKDDRMLLIAHDLVEFIKYNNIRKSITWENCSLRQWMNGEFYESAFSSDEKQKILSTRIENRDSSNGVNGGNDTYDKVFSLSTDEARTYFSDDSQRKARYTEHIRNYNMSSDSQYEWWWLRSPGEYSHNAALVDNKGKIVEIHGDPVDDNDIAVRPAMWISI